MHIKNLPSHLRPREKALREGIESLSDVELLALFLRHGTKDIDVIDLSKNIIKSFGGLKFLNHVSFHDLTKIKGLGKVKALELKALFEFSKRSSTTQILKIKDHRDATQIAFKQIAHKKNENFLLVLLSFSNVVISSQILYQGTEDKIDIDPKDIISEVLKRGGKKFYCFHNHPSGDTQPSNADKLMTKRLQYYCDLFNIKMIAHIVINEKGDYSIVE